MSPCNYRITVLLKHSVPRITSRFFPPFLSYMYLAADQRFWDKKIFPLLLLFLSLPPEPIKQYSITRPNYSAILGTTNITSADALVAGNYDFWRLEKTFGRAKGNRANQGRRRRSCCRQISESHSVRRQAGRQVCACVCVCILIASLASLSGYIWCIWSDKVMAAAAAPAAAAGLQLTWSQGQWLQQSAGRVERRKEEEKSNQTIMLAVVKAAGQGWRKIKCENHGIFSKFHMCLL